MTLKEMGLVLTGQLLANASLIIVTSEMHKANCEEETDGSVTAIFNWVLSSFWREEHI